MKISLCLLFMMLVLSAVAQSNPVPLVNNPLVPSSTLPGGTAFTLTVNGTGFVTGSTVDWNGVGLQTTFVSGSQLKATVPAANIATVGTASVTVVSPAPGGGSSNVAWFSVRKPFPAVSFGETEAPAGFLPAFPVAADLNSDGKLDVAVIDFGDSAVGVLLGNGDRTFQAPVEYAVGLGGPQSLVCGDFNGDGRVDLVVYDFNGLISVLIGNGDGTFQLSKNTSTVVNGHTLVSGDFNGDGIADIAISVTSPTGEVAVMLGDGRAGFEAPTFYAAGAAAESVAIGDFNGDGRLDLAASGYSQQNMNTVAILLGNGDGTFQPAQDFDAGSAPEGIVAADFNGDNKIDLVVKTASGFSALLGNGDGSFQPPITYAGGGSGFFISIGELNGDGKLDVLVPEPFSTTVLLGTGDGHFSGTGLFSSARSPEGIVVGDFNNDGLIDLVVPDANTNQISILPQVTSVLSNTLTDFGSVKLGKSKTRQVTLMNYGDKVLSIDRIGVQGDDASVFSETNTCGSGVQPGKSCKIAITFTPQAPHIYTQARVAIRDSATRLSQKIMLEGMGLK